MVAIGADLYPGQNRVAARKVSGYGALIRIAKQRQSTLRLRAQAQPAHRRSYRRPN